MVLEAFVEAAAGAEEGSGGGEGGGRAGASWVALDERRGLAFPGRHARVEFSLGAEGARGVAARRWRLRVVRVADPAAANSVQLACLDLYTSLCDGEGGGAAAARQR